ncbi:hypothetical protein QJS10_CPB15g00735 [Acorus calamus]|uniref:Uncharacterized protein n=1 Tax=Acorus calamus TaxID=4465 RepID=A0AAV9D8E1_ACOCL|nr:hypothetical protein QJS10_CPB15g00735 [Acorus calamus]
MSVWSESPNVGVSERILAVRGCVRVWGLFGDSDRMRALAGSVRSSSWKGEVSLLVEMPDSGSRGFQGNHDVDSHNFH